MSENSSARTWVIEPDSAERTSGKRSVMPPGWMPVPWMVVPAAFATASISGDAEIADGEGDLTHLVLSERGRCWLRCCRSSGWRNWTRPAS